jgi:aerobic C4-dicarboxylate transport protein
MKRKPFYTILYVQVLAAIIAGVLLGHFAPQAAVAL